MTWTTNITVFPNDTNSCQMKLTVQLNLSNLLLLCVYQSRRLFVINSYFSSFSFLVPHWDPYAMQRRLPRVVLLLHGGVVLVGFKPYLKDQLHVVSFSALTLLVWSYDL